MALCESKFPDLVCRPVVAQFMQGDVIALFAFARTEDGARILMEHHYELVDPNELTSDDLAVYRQRS